MPSILSHGIIGYLLFGKKGFFIGILPDLIGNAFFTLKTMNKYDTYNPLKVIGHAKHTDFSDNDYIIYKLSHSLLLWLLILLITNYRDLTSFREYCQSYTNKIEISFHYC